MKCQRYAGCNRLARSQRRLCRCIHVPPQLNPALLHLAPALLHPPTQDPQICQDCNGSRLENVSWDLVIIFFQFNLWLAYFIKFILFFFLQLCNCLAKDVKHMWVTSPVLCGSNDCRFFSFSFFFCSSEAMERNLITLLAGRKCIGHVCKRCISWLGKKKKESFFVSAATWARCFQICGR